MRWRSNGGFSLVEVLVALFVVAVGVAGATASQMAAQRARREAARVSGAVQLAASLSDRMRANTAVMAAGDTANPYLQLDYDAASAAPPPAVSCAAGADCAPDELARFDLYETALALKARLPRGRIVVCRDASPWDAAAHALAWACRPSAHAPIIVKIGWPQERGGAHAPQVALMVPQ